jgi:multiple sugar transport system substrate-binding protein
MPKRISVLPRRSLLAGAVATTGLLVIPGRAPAHGGRKKLDGVTLHVTCFSHTYSEFLRSYLPEFEEATGAKIVYDTPAFPIYNQRMDIELSTKSAAHDVINVTFIYSGRWVGAGWTTPLDEFIKDPKNPPGFRSRRLRTRCDYGLQGRRGRSPCDPVDRRCPNRPAPRVTI